MALGGTAVRGRARNEVAGGADGVGGWRRHEEEVRPRRNGRWRRLGGCEASVAVVSLRGGDDGMEAAWRVLRGGDRRGARRARHGAAASLPHREVGWSEAVAMRPSGPSRAAWLRRRRR